MTDTLTQPSTLVVGGAGGIGQCTVLRLLADGHRVAVIDQSAEACQSLAETVARQGATVAVREGDACDPQLVHDVLQELADGGTPVTGLVHCAGTYADPRAFRAISVTEWRRVLDACLTSAFVSTQQAMRWMYPLGRGRIVVLSSVMALHIGKTLDDVAYTSAKEGLHGLVRSLARSLGRRNITVNAVAPGLVDTKLTETLLHPATNGSLEMAWARTCPLERMCTGEEVASVIAFLLSKDASFINGAVIPVDGGFHC